MNNINICHYEGYLKNEDRKCPLSHCAEGVEFASCIDLSQPVKVSSNYEVTLEQYSVALACFIGWWTIFIREDLNGFSGFDCVKFDTTGLKLIKKD
jgi:hypothetical protein